MEGRGRFVDLVIGTYMLCVLVTWGAALAGGEGSVGYLGLFALTLPASFPVVIALPFGAPLLVTAMILLGVGAVQAAVARWALHRLTRP